MKKNAKKTAAKVAKIKPTTVTRVDRLTPEQESRFGEWRDKWISIGLCTEPADRETFERAALEWFGGEVEP